MGDIIKFYSRTKRYFEFSNYSAHPITIGGLTYPTNEHYFQSVKFLDEDYRERVRNAKTSAESKRMGGNRQQAIWPDWDTRRIDVMREAVYAKFTQHPTLRKLLLSTGDAILVEDSPTDYYWGCGADGTGQNMLGKLLMELRDKLREEATG